MTTSQAVPILILTMAVVAYAGICAWAGLDVWHKRNDRRCVVVRPLMLQIVRELAVNVLLPFDSASNASGPSAWVKTAYDFAVGVLFIVQVFLPGPPPRNEPAQEGRELTQFGGQDDAA